MHAHIRVSLRLISLNFGDPQYCSGTCSRAYSSVNGTNSNDANEIRARIAAAMPRAYRATQWAVVASATNATTTKPVNVTTAPTSSSFGRPLRTPGTAITAAATSAAIDPSLSVECATSTVNKIQGTSAMKIPFPPALGSALSLLVDDMNVSF